MGYARFAVIKRLLNRVLVAKMPVLHYMKLVNWSYPDGVPCIIILHPLILLPGIITEIVLSILVLIVG